MGALREPKLLKLEVRTPQNMVLYSKSATASLPNLCYNCIDYFIREDYNDVSEQLLSLGRNNLKFYISYLTVANFAYIVRKMPRDVVSSMIQRICETFRIVRNTKEQIERNVILCPTDFEDGLQYQAAMDAGCDCIITRNQKDFGFSEIPVMDASEFLRKIS